MQSAAPVPPVIAEVVRNGFVEAVHRGSVVGLRADGSIALSLGDPAAAIFPRSSNKPMQAVGMVGCGLALDGPLLALAAASHSGEPFHLDGVRQILAGAGLQVSDLQTPPDYPYDIEAQRDWIRAGNGPLGPARLILNGPPWGPYLILVGPPGPPPQDADRVPSEP